MVVLNANHLIMEHLVKSQKIVNYYHEIEATDSKVYQMAVMEYYLKHVLRNKKLLKAKRKPNVNGEKIYSRKGVIRAISKKLIRFGDGLLNSR